MEIDPTSLQGHDKEDIISVFIEHVVKTEEEVEEKETGVAKPRTSNSIYSIIKGLNLER